MTGKEMDLGRLFVREAIKAGTWGFIFLIIMGMFIASVERDIRESIAFGIDHLVYRVLYSAANPYTLEKS